MMMTILNRKDEDEEIAGKEKAEFKLLNSALVILI